MSFANAVKSHVQNAPARTANGMKARATSASPVLDLFGKIGSARGVDVTSNFAAALADNEELAIRTLLWARDIREGAGERQTFRTLLAALEAVNPALAGRIMHKIPELGRFDDLFTYKEYNNRVAALEFYGAALLDGNGLAFKWAPREKSAKRGPAKELMQTLGMTPRQYRKFLAENTVVTETLMCARQWDNINFSHVPSVASARYQKAFGRNASEAYSKYIRELQKPEAERAPGVKVNAGAVYPYDVVKSVSQGNVAVADAQWAALPNFVGDARIFAMVDTSASMGHLGNNGYSYMRSGTSPQPIEVAVSLGLYVSEKLTSAFKDMLMIFDSTPKLLTVKGSLSQRMAQLPEIVSGSTNLHAAFDLLLKIAVQGNVRSEDMPEQLLILSDMQFNSCVRFDDSAQEMIRRKYHTAGYEVPKIVFWNLNAGYGSTPVSFNDRGVALVSGFSPAIMKSVLANDLEEFTPYSVMTKTLMNERYAY
jgi:hypothetical protein